MFNVNKWRSQCLHSVSIKWSKLLAKGCLTWKVVSYCYLITWNKKIKLFITTCKWSCGKVMFSQVSLCLQGTIPLGPYPRTVPPGIVTPLEPYPPRTYTTWDHTPTPNYWHLVTVNTCLVTKQMVCMLLEYILILSYLYQFSAPVNDLKNSKFQKSKSHEMK